MDARSAFWPRAWRRARTAVTDPGRVAGYLVRAGRNAWLHTIHRDHVSYYRAVMASDAARSAAAAVGGQPSLERWHRLGQMQFDYLVAHGLRPGHRLLEIGCGDLRAGRLFIRLLEPGHYYGLDISPEILLAARRTLVRDGLQSKMPYLALVDDLTFDFLPDEGFDVVHAHSVFSHSPRDVIETCLANVGRILAPGGFFDFTFDRTEGREHHVRHEDFYYRTGTLVGLAARHGLAAQLLDDWEEGPHIQSKMRVTRMPKPTGTPPS